MSTNPTVNESKSESKLTPEQLYYKTKAAGIDYAKTAVYTEKNKELKNLAAKIMGEMGDLLRAPMDNTLRQNAMVEYGRMAEHIDEEIKALNSIVDWLAVNNMLETQQPVKYTKKKLKEKHLLLVKLGIPLGNRHLMSSILENPNQEFLEILDLKSKKEFTNLFKQLLVNNFIPA